MRLIFISLFLTQLTFAKEISEKRISYGDKDYLITITSKPSRPKAKGRGFCGAGKEVTLQIFETRSKKMVFSKLIESCLKTIELRGRAESIDLDANPILLHWLIRGDKTNVTAAIDFSSGRPVYSEK
jgi:hypothetical protein